MILQTPMKNLEFLDKTNLINLGFSGIKFTWTNCRDSDALIRTRIYKAHANADWINLFPETQVTHLPRLTTDHCTVLL